MAGNHKRRKRKVDVSKMTPEQADRLEKQLTQEISRIMDSANLECNKLLNIFGIQTKIHYEFVPLSEKKEKIKKEAKL